MERSQQLIIPMNLELQIPEDAPVRMLGEILDRMDFGCLERAEKRGSGRKTPGRILFGLFVFGEINGIYSSRKIEDYSRYDVRYRWLLEGCPVPDHSTLSRFRGAVLAEYAEELFGQLMGILRDMEEIDYEHLFVDGSKLEAFANRYSFVWKKSVEKNLLKLREKAAVLLARPSETLSLDAVRIALAQQETLCQEKGIKLVSGKGRRKSPEQRRLEALGSIAARWEEYRTKLDIIGSHRGSYSKTDHDATFLRMKDDHMMNGQLKAGYNAQIGVSGEYIVGIEAFQSASDNATLPPFLDSIQRLHGRRFGSVTTDAGYESLENYLYLEENQQLCFIKPTNYERSKKKKNRNWVGRREDMNYAPEQNVFICQGGMALWPMEQKTRKSSTGFVSVSTIYRCEDCRDCALRTKCTRARDGRSKCLEVNHDFSQLREGALRNITSPLGVQLRINRSIMVEGAFGVIKQDYGFRRFLLRGKPKVQTELFLLAFAFNVRKLHARTVSNRTGSQLFERKTS